MPAIKAVNSRDLKVTSCVFSGFDTDIELENVEGFISENNSFSRGNSPQILINPLINSIKESKLDDTYSFSRLFSPDWILKSLDNTMQKHESD